MMGGLLQSVGVSAGGQIGNPMLQEPNMQGSWSTPFSLDFSYDQGVGAYRSQGIGDSWLITFERSSDAINLTMRREGSPEVVTGGANFEFTRIQWESGAVWTKNENMVGSRDMGGMGGATPKNPGAFFSKHQEDLLIDRLNAAVDIPLMDEGTERKLIFEPLVRKLNPMLGPALTACLPKDACDLVQLMLDDSTQGTARGAKRRDTYAILKRNLNEPLVRQLHKKVDMAMIPDEIEIKCLKKIVSVAVGFLVDHVLSGFEKLGPVNVKDGHHP